jgi:hypothetical protein
MASIAAKAVQFSSNGTGMARGFLAAQVTLDVFGGWVTLMIVCPVAIKASLASDP